MTLTHTYVRTLEAVRFADPYKVCTRCGQWVDGALPVPLERGPSILIPCEHAEDYRGVCPSWGPVDGCRCTPKGHGRTEIPDGKVP